METVKVEGRIEGTPEAKAERTVVQEDRLKALQAKDAYDVEPLKVLNPRTEVEERELESLLEMNANTSGPTQEERDRLVVLNNRSTRTREEEKERLELEKKV